MSSEIFIHEHWRCLVKCVNTFCFSWCPLLQGVKLPSGGEKKEHNLYNLILNNLILYLDGGNGFVDVLDAQWECEGELIPLDLSVLNPREFLVYQHGLFLIDTLHNLKLVGAQVSL